MDFIQDSFTAWGQPIDPADLPTDTSGISFTDSGAADPGFSWLGGTEWMYVGPDQPFTSAQVVESAGKIWPLLLFGAVVAATIYVTR